MANGGYYAYNIYYTISNGYSPFDVELVGSSLPINTHTDLGTYMFSAVTIGTYTLKIIDGNNCIIEYNIKLDEPPPVVIEYAQDYDDETFYNYDGEPFTITINE